MTKTIFITGTSSGIGLATAKYFWQQGWNVVATMRDTNLVTDLPTDKRLLKLKVDVTRESSLKTAVTIALKQFGQIDVLVNNAGYGLVGPFETATPQQIEAQFQTNVFGIFNATRALLPHFKEHRSGIIINIASMMGRITLPFFSLYSATKWSVEGFSESLRYELEPFGIQVKVIEPGTIKTDFFTRSLVETTVNQKNEYSKWYHQVISNTKERGKNGEDPQVVAKSIYKAVCTQNNQFRFIPDHTARLLLFLRSISPLWLFSWVVKKTVK